MKKSLKSIVVLVCICAVTALLLAATNSITAPIIKKNEAAAADAALLKVLPTGEDFEKIDLSTYKLPSSVTEAHREKNGGYVIKLVTTGFGSGLTIMCGVNPDGTVSGALCLASSETLGYEKIYGDQFVGKNAEGVDSVDTISNATMTTSAYRAAIKDALNAAVILGGGSVDIRTEEEILADNLTAALPAADGNFERVFLVEALEGINAVYAAENGKGYVCVVGELFVGVDADGKVIGDVSSEIAASVASQIMILKASKSEALDLTRYEGVHKNVVSVSKTQTGNYDVTVKGAGYGINGEYHASGEYITVRVSMTGEGKIIDCLTLSHKETDGLGSACGNESFYSQFVGKTEANYKEIDAISGATLTTDGYKNAIRRAFEAVNIFEGRTAS